MTYKGEKTIHSTVEGSVSDFMWNKIHV